MPKSTDSRLGEMAQEAQIAAYAAYREWPVCVVLRHKELLARQAKATPPAPTAVPAAGSMERKK